MLLTHTICMNDVVYSTCIKGMLDSMMHDVQIPRLCRAHIILLHVCTCRFTMYSS